MIKWLAISAMLVPVSLHASDGCMLADEMDASLVDWYGERAIAETQRGDAALWSNAQTGTWTIVEYRKSGMACVLASGTNLADAPGTELMVRLPL